MRGTLQLQYVRVHCETIFYTLRVTFQFGTTKNKSKYSAGSYESCASLLGHREKMSKVFWVLVSALFNVIKLSKGGYFGDKAKKWTKVSGLDDDERFVANLLVAFLEMMRYNTHAVLESNLKTKVSTVKSRFNECRFNVKSRFKE